jgi:hypothetical protein
MGTLHHDQYPFLIISRSVLLKIINFSNKSCRDETHILYAITFFPPKIVPFLRYVEKYCKDGQATDDNMAHARCLLDT